MAAEREGVNKPIESPGGLQPVSERQRVAFVDALRGFALLGILIPNILTFAWPIDLMTNEPLMPESAAAEASMWFLDNFVLMKFMLLFSMLFGVGIVLWDRKTQGRSITAGTGRWYARCGWLAVFGVLHGVLLWYGDILLLYALAGMVGLWFLRRLPSWALIPIGLCVYSVGTGFMLLAAWAQSTQPEGAGMPPFMPTEQSQIEAYTSGYVEGWWGRLVPLFFMWVNIPFLLIWWAAGNMCIGMGLARCGFLLGKSPAWVYGTVLAVGTPLGLGATIGLHGWAEAGDGVLRHFVFFAVVQLIGMPLSLGYASAIALVVKAAARSRIAAAVSGAFANVGRMALSNYLLHSIICAVLFYGYGVGLYAQVEFPALWGVIAAIWAFNFVLSAMWLRAFRYGPFEWLWRSLTYWRLEPMRHETGPPQGTPGPVHSAA